MGMATIQGHRVEIQKANEGKAFIVAGRAAEMLHTELQKMGIEPGELSGNQFVVERAAFHADAFSNFPSNTTKAFFSQFDRAASGHSAAME